MERAPADTRPPAGVATVTGSGIPGYRLRDLEATLPAETVAAFHAWLVGQTVGLDADGATVVYAHDWAQWARGGWPLD